MFKHQMTRSGKHLYRAEVNGAVRHHVSDGELTHAEAAQALGLSVSPAAPAVAMQARAAAVITTSASDTRYLPGALLSVLDQLLAFDEVVVVEDARVAGDEVRQLCERSGVRYLRTPANNPSEARRAGVELTTATHVLCLDADNELSPRWLQEHLAAGDPSVGVVYAGADRVGPDGTYLGPYAAVADCTHDELRRQNRIDTCALVRRDALDEAGGWVHPEGGMLEDWHLWLRLTGLGWRTSYIDQTLWRYRDNPAGLSAATDGVGYRSARAAVLREVGHLWVVTAFCGREWALKRTLDSYQRIGWPAERCHLLAIDNSRGALRGLPGVFSRACADWASVTVVADRTESLPGVTNDELAASAELRTQHEWRLGCAVRRLYAELAARHLPPAADLVFTLEDDVELTTHGASRHLLDVLDEDVMAVGALVNCRFPGGFGPIAWEQIADDPFTFERASVGLGPQAVGGVAYGATLWRAEAWRNLLPRRLLVNDRPGEAPPWHDLVFAADIRRAGYRMRLHPDVGTRHWREDGTWV